MKNKFKYILIPLIIVIIILLIKILFNKTNQLEPLALQLETVREIDEYDFRVMGETWRDKIYEKYDTVKFGHYMQDKKGKKKTPIEWIVLDKKDDKVFLFSKYILDLQNFNDEYKEISWKDCSLRKWLNNEFYDIAFSNEEKKKILETTNVNKGYKEVPFYDTKDSKDTVDKVFLLSQDEINIYFKNDGIYDNEKLKQSRIEKYGEYSSNVANATTKATDYAINQYMEYYEFKDEDEIKHELNVAFNKDKGETFDYWLRNYACRNTISTDDDLKRATIVNFMGRISTMDYSLGVLNGIRPAIWVSLN